MIRGLPVILRYASPLPPLHRHRRLCIASASSPRAGTSGRFSMQTLDLDGLRLNGISVGGVETCLTLPSLSLAFDTGRGASFSMGMRTVALTHGHCDHVIGLPLHVATRRMQKLPPATYVVPPAIADDVKALTDAVQRLERASFEYDLRAIGPGDEMLEVLDGWFLKAFATEHTVPSQGYLLYRRKKRLRDEFRAMPGAEIGRLRKSGVEVEDFFLSLEVAFTGDTAFAAIERNAELRRAKILITEMTFVDNKCTPENAKRFGHTHIDDVCAGSHVFAENQHVVFTHFSARYKKECILEAMRTLPPALRDKSVALVGA